MNKKPKYKDIHGTTRIGDFLRGIKKSNLIGDAVDMVADLSTGNVLGALQTLLGKDEGISQEQREHALELIRLDIEQDKGITTRWTADLRWGNFITKTIRPFILFCLTATFIVGFFLKEYEMEVVGNMLSIVLTAYFGSRGAEKIFGGTNI